MSQTLQVLTQLVACPFFDLIRKLIKRGQAAASRDEKDRGETRRINYFIVYKPESAVAAAAARFQVDGFFILKLTDESSELRKKQDFLIPTPAQQEL